MTRFFSLILFLVCQTGLIGQKPCLQVLAENTCPVPSPPDALTSELLIPFKHDNISAGLTVGNDSARYKAFWIFGDGNYRSFPDRHKSADESTLATDYQYQIPDRYTSIAVLVEKKSDGEPPGSSYRPLRITPATSGNAVSNQGNNAALKKPGIEFNDRIKTPNTADIESSSKVRLGGYETAFAVSSKLPSPSTQSVVLFFFNSVKLKDGTEFQALPLFSAAELNRANYTSEAYKIGNVTDLPAPISAAFSRYFQYVIAQPLEVNNDLKPSKFSEFRVFPLLKTNPRKPDGTIDTGIPALDDTGMGETQFVTLVLDNVSVNPEYDTAGNSTILRLLPNSANVPLSNSAEENTQILSLIDQYYNPLKESISDPVTLAVEGNMFISGFAYHSDEIVTSIDPTELRILQICLKDGKYDVQMQMTVCNEGNIAEDSIVVDLRNTGGILIENLNCDASQFTRLVTPSTPDAIITYAYTKGLPGFYQIAQTGDSNCFDVKFDFKTDWNSVQKLRDGGALTAKVHFTGAEIKPVSEFPNIALETKAVREKAGYNCEKKDDYLWLIVVVFALLIVAWWYWKNKEDE